MLLNLSTNDHLLVEIDPSLVEMPNGILDQAKRFIPFWSFGGKDTTNPPGT